MPIAIHILKTDAENVLDVEEKFINPKMELLFDSFLEQKAYLRLNPDYMLLGSRDNVAQFLDTATGEKCFIGIYPLSENA